MTIQPGGGPIAQAKTRLVHWPPESCHTSADRLPTGGTRRSSSVQPWGPVSNGCWVAGRRRWNLHQLRPSRGLMFYPRQNASPDGQYLGKADPGRRCGSFPGPRSTGPRADGCASAPNVLERQ